jgi:hypothetical protein
LLQERDAGADLRPAKVTMIEVFDQYVTQKPSQVKASSLGTHG